MKPAGEAPFCVAWARTESYAIEGKEVWCKEMAFDILEYPEQFSTDPDPVLAVAAYIKKIFPETTVLGIDNVGDFVIKNSRVLLQIGKYTAYDRALYEYDFMVCREDCCTFDLSGSWHKVKDTCIYQSEGSHR